MWRITGGWSSTRKWNFINPPTPPRETWTISANSGVPVNYEFIRSFPAHVYRFIGPLILPTRGPISSRSVVTPIPVRVRAIARARSISFHNRSIHPLYPYPRSIYLLLWGSYRYSPIQQILDRLVSVLQIQIPRLPGQHYRRLELRQVGRKSVIELERGREHHASPFVHGNRNRDADRELENGGRGGEFKGRTKQLLSQGGRRNRRGGRRGRRKS